MKERSVSRRRFLRVSALCGAGAVFPGAAVAAQREAARAAGLREWRWEGVLFGAAAELTFFVRERKEGRDLTRRCVAEMRRLENIFSIYIETSALRRLNAAGVLAKPPTELIELLRRSQSISRATGGAFDVTVQPLWELYRDHFKRHPEGVTGPSAKTLERVREVVGWQAMAIEDGQIRFLKPGMGVTLNGIAQGFITDHVAGMLRDAGVDDVLVNLGEYRAAGNPGDGEPWRVGIASAESAFDLVDAVELRDSGFAVSAGHGWSFDREGKYHHLIHPAGAGFTDGRRTVAIEAPDATLADALSTACGVSADAAARRMAARFEGVTLRIYGGAFCG